MKRKHIKKIARLVYKQMCDAEDKHFTKYLQSDQFDKDFEEYLKDNLLYSACNIAQNYLDQQPNFESITVKANCREVNVRRDTNVNDTLRCIFMEFDLPRTATMYRYFEKKDVVDYINCIILEDKLPVDIYERIHNHFLST